MSVCRFLPADGRPGCRTQVSHGGARGRPLFSPPRLERERERPLERKQQVGKSQVAFVLEMGVGPVVCFSVLNTMARK